MAKYVISKESEAETASVLKHLITKKKEDNDNTIPDNLIGSLNLLEDAYNTYIQINQIIKQDGLMIPDRYGNFNKHPLLVIKNSTKLQIIRLLSELQMTPKSKAKVKEVEEEEEEESPLIKFLNQPK